MDLLTVIGALFGAAAIGVGFWLEGGHFGTLLQGEAFVIVLGGTLSAVMIQNTWSRFFDGIKRLHLAFMKARQVDRKSLSTLLEWGDQAKLNGMLVFESIEAGGINPFAKRGLELLANGVSTAVLEDALQRELDAYERNHMAAARIWQQAGGYAPTFGILGAVLGLIQVMKHLQEMEKVGHGIATAFVATVYGVALANLFFLPAAAKIRNRAEDLLNVRSMMLEGISQIVQGTHPKIIEQRLSTYAATGQNSGKAAAARASLAREKAA